MLFHLGVGEHFFVGIWYNGYEVCAKESAGFMGFLIKEFAYFFIATFLLYYLVPKKIQWVVLLVANTYFYYASGWKSFVFLTGTILVSYGLGLLIEKTKKKSLVMWGSILIFVAMLCAMRVLPAARSIMPLGLSFYSLQCIGYMIEVYRGSTEAEKNPLKYYVYISYFPHVLQGPFADYNELKKKIFAPHAFDYDKAVYGCYRFVWGFMKKQVIAERIGNIVNPIFATGEGYYGATVFYAMVLYCIQLYADFSGYMDMAVGVSYGLGIELQENFNVPYRSKSMAEFWRRWHMSLGLWFKNYVFYPMLRTKLCTSIRAKMKAKKNKYAMNVLPTTIGLFVNWTLIGLWHGFDANYLCYDWACGLIIILSEFAKPLYDKVNKAAPKFMQSKFMDAVRVVRTFILVGFTFLLFRPDTLAVSKTLFVNMFTKPGIKQLLEYGYWNLYDEFLIFLPIVLLCIVDSLKYKGVNVYEKVHKWPFVIRWLIYISALIMVYVSKFELAKGIFAYYVF